MVRVSESFEPEAPRRLLSLHRYAVEIERLNAVHSLLRASRLDVYRTLLTPMLAEHPRLRATRLYEMMLDRRYQGSVVQAQERSHQLSAHRFSELWPVRLACVPGHRGSPVTLLLPWRFHRRRAFEDRRVL